MTGYGTYNLPPGTWSDDSSLTFCLAEALTIGFDLKIISQNFVKWYYQNYWTPRGKVFDIGNATRDAIEKLADGIQPDLAGGDSENSNGNGSLMRIAPLLFILIDKTIHERFAIAGQVSSITHRHICSVIACFYYLEFLRQFFFQKDKLEIYKNLQSEVPAFLYSISVSHTEIERFHRLFKQNIYQQNEENIFSDGYVVHTLEASLWCLLTTDNYKSAVLKAVNLGKDTDTTSAVTGGLAGLLYGIDNIPESWLRQIARYDDINKFAQQFALKLNNTNV